MFEKEGGDKIMYTVEEVAKLLNLKPTTIRTWIKQKKLKGTKIGKSYRISKDELKKLFPEGLFFFPADSFEIDKPPVEVLGNEKLHQELYPESFEEAQARNTYVDSWEAFKEKITEDIKRRFPYPFKGDEVAYWNQDHTNYLQGSDPDAWDIFYSGKYKEEVDKFNRLLEMFQEKYGLKDEDIVEIKRTSENIILLTCGREIHRVER